MSCPIKGWLKRFAIVKTVDIQLTTSSAQLLAADPSRFAIILPSLYNDTSIYRFDPVNSSTGPIYLNQSMPTIILTEETVGDLVTYPLFGRCATAPAPIAITTVSYNPERLRAYDRFLESQLSKLGPS